ncbi:MAG: tol-pal system protein YbgF [Gallionellaceae bacterium]
MRQQRRALLLAALCFAGGQAYAGLFSDDEARQQVQQVGARVSSLEEAGKQQAEINKQQADTNKQQTDTANQQTRSLLDLQSQIDAQNTQLRTLLGQNEELTHELQDAEKRQKDFYIDLDSRLRHVEEVQASTPPPPVAPPAKANATADTDDPAVENRAYEAAYQLFKAAKYEDAISEFQAFLKQFPESVQVPNVHYEMGSIFFAQKDYKNALDSYQLLVSKYSYSPKTAGAMLGIADCQEALGEKVAARKTLRLIASKYAGSETAGEAKKRLTKLK